MNRNRVAAPGLVILLLFFTLVSGLPFTDNSDESISIDSNFGVAEIDRMNPILIDFSNVSGFDEPRWKKMELMPDGRIALAFDNGGDVWQESMYPIGIRPGTGHQSLDELGARGEDNITLAVIEIDGTVDWVRRIYVADGTVIDLSVSNEGRVALLFRYCEYRGILQLPRTPVTGHAPCHLMTLDPTTSIEMPQFPFRMTRGMVLQSWDGNNAMGLTLLAEYDSSGNVLSLNNLSTDGETYPLTPQSGQFDVFEKHIYGWSSISHNEDGMLSGVMNHCRLSCGTTEMRINGTNFIHEQYEMINQNGTASINISLPSSWLVNIHPRIADTQEWPAPLNLDVYGTLQDPVRINSSWSVLVKELETRDDTVLLGGSGCLNGGDRNDLTGGFHGYLPLRCMILSIGDVQGSIVNESIGFISSVDQEGSVGWIRTIPATKVSSVIDFAELSDGSIAVLGEFKGGLLYEGGLIDSSSCELLNRADDVREFEEILEVDLIEPLRWRPSADGMFIARYSPTGTLMWLRSAGGEGCVQVNEIAVDSQDQIHFVGTHNGTMTWGLQETSSDRRHIGIYGTLSKEGDWLSVHTESSSENTTFENILVTDGDEVLIAAQYEMYYFDTSFLPPGTGNFIKKFHHNLTTTPVLLRFEKDLDVDRIPDEVDNCPFVSNVDQADLDGDGEGDACDGDWDGDWIPNPDDDCSRGLIGWVSNWFTDYDGDGCRDDAEDDDDDQDGIPDDLDRCPKGVIGPWDRGLHDYDGDGCHDELEDPDDDDDGVDDGSDRCPRGDLNWTSTPASDYDSDGCRDATEDLDDDDDGILDTLDGCTPGLLGWISDQQNDHDSDGCRDIDEDSDDDADDVADVDDDCPRGEIGWTQTDHDGDGCRDETEDLDDDGDGVLDEDDRCPVGATDWTSALDTDWDADGCRDADEDLDDDGDGILDTEDACPLSPVDWVRRPDNDRDSDGCLDEQVLIPDGADPEHPQAEKEETSDGPAWLLPSTSLIGLLIGLLLVIAHEPTRFAVSRRTAMIAVIAAIGDRPTKSGIALRTELEGFIFMHPGIHYGDICRHFGISNGQAAHHLYIMEKEGLVNNQRHGRRLCFFSHRSGVLTLDPSQISLFCVLNWIDRGILDMVCEGGGMMISQTVLAERLLTSQPTISRRLKRLEAKGLIEWRNVSGLTCIELGAGIAELLDRIRPYESQSAEEVDYESAM